MRKLPVALVPAVLAVLIAPVRAQDDEGDWKTVHARGVAELEAWKPVEARASLERAVELARGFDAPDERLARSLIKLADALELLRARAPAEKALREALTIREGLHGTESVELRAVLERLSRCRRAANDFAGAAELMRRLLAILDAAPEDDGVDSLEVVVRLAKDLRSLGRVAETVPLFERGLATMEKRLGKDHPDLVHPLADLAQAYDGTKRYREAADLYRRWIVIYEKARGENHPSIALGLENLAAVQMAAGDAAGAETTYRRWLDIVIAVTNDDNPNVAALLGRIARAVAAQEGPEKTAKAIATFERAIAMYEKHMRKEHRVIAPLLEGLSEEQTAAAKHDDAIASARRAVKIVRGAPMSDPIALDRALLVLSRAQAAAGSWDEANITARELVARIEARAGPTHPALLEPLERMAAMLAKLGNEKAAAEAEARAKAVREANEKRTSRPSDP